MMAGRIPRKRQKTVRLGESDENVDDLFEEIDRRESTKSDDKDEDYVNSSRTSSEVSNSGSVDQLKQQHWKRMDIKDRQRHKSPESKQNSMKCIRF